MLQLTTPYANLLNIIYMYQMVSNDSQVINLIYCFHFILPTLKIISKICLMLRNVPQFFNSPITILIRPAAEPVVPIFCWVVYDIGSMNNPSFLLRTPITLLKFSTFLQFFAILTQKR